MKIIFTSFLFCLGLVGFSQSDTLNIVNEVGQKHGLWVTYGKDRPSLGYCDSCIVEPGKYIKDEKEGPWITYDKEGNIKRTVIYKNGKPQLTDVYNPSRSTLDSLSDNQSQGKDIYNLPKDTTLSDLNDGFHLVYNHNQEIWMEGYFEGGRLIDGKLYKYDAEGFLIIIEIWKAGRKEKELKDW